MVKSSRRRKPMDPAEIARRKADQKRNPHLWGFNAEALAMPSNADVTAEPATRKNEARARRYDVFSLFLAQGSLSQEAEQAVRTLQADVAILHRTAGARDTSGAKVDSSGSAEAFSASRIAAGASVEAARQAVGPLSWRILEALNETIITGAAVNWHAVVERITGEGHPMARGALVRAAASNLAEHYRAPVKARRAA